VAYNAMHLVLSGTTMHKKKRNELADIHAIATIDASASDTRCVTFLTLV
jgi:hypothetical protein